MQHRPFLLAVLLALLCPSGSGAQQLAVAAPGDAAIPPSPPFVAPVPAKARWTISVRYEGESAAPVPGESAETGRIRRIESVRVGAIKRDTVFSDGGKPYEVWFVGDKALKLNSAGNDVMILSAAAFRPTAATNPEASSAELERGNPVHSPGFSGLDWVKEKYYDGVVLLQNVSCYHYVLSASGDEGKPAVAEAWIQVKGGLPVAYAAAGTVYTFSFQPAPESLVLPVLYQKAMEESKRADDHFQQLLKDAGVR